MTDPDDNLTPYLNALQHHAEVLAHEMEIDPRLLTEGGPGWPDPDVETALDRARAESLSRFRRARIEAEIEERRPRIRRAAALAETLIAAAGPGPMTVAEPRPKTVAGIAVVRAARRHNGVGS